MVSADQGRVNQIGTIRLQSRQEGVEPAVVLLLERVGRGREIDWAARLVGAERRAAGICISGYVSAAVSPQSNTPGDVGSYPAEVGGIDILSAGRVYFRDEGIERIPIASRVLLKRVVGYREMDSRCRSWGCAGIWDRGSWFGRTGRARDVSRSVSIDRDAEGYVVAGTADVRRVDAELTRRIDLGQVSIEPFLEVVEMRRAAVNFS